MIFHLNQSICIDFWLDGPIASQLSPVRTNGLRVNGGTTDAFDGRGGGSSATPGIYTSSPCYTAIFNNKPTPLKVGVEMSSSEGGGFYFLFNNYFYGLGSHPIERPRRDNWTEVASVFLRRLLHLLFAAFFYKIVFASPFINLPLHWSISIPPLSRKSRTKTSWGVWHVPPRI